MKTYWMYDGTKLIAVVNSVQAMFAVHQLYGRGLQWRAKVCPPLVSRDLNLINGRMQ